MATFPVTEHYAEAFTTNVELLSQQLNHRFEGTYVSANYVGKSAQVVKQFGTVEFDEKTGKHQDTVLSELQHEQRWVFPSDFNKAMPIENADEVRTLGSIQSPYVQAMAAGWNRKKDEVISAALIGDAKTGTNGGTTTVFNASNTIPAGGVGLTIGKLISAREILGENEVLESGEQPYLAVTQEQLSDLLNSTTVTSADFNTIKALVNGEIDTFVGFKFIRYQSLAEDATPDRRCPFWVPSGIHLGMWAGLTTDIGPRRDKMNLTQIFMEGVIGATRTQETKVGEIICVEA